MSIVKYQSRVKERTPDGRTTSIVYTGTRDEMLTMQETCDINGQSEEGRLKSVRVNQESPNIWRCEMQYASDLNGEYATPPDASYGKKSAQLKGTRLSLPLESHPGYLTNWNHYLAAAPSVTAVPDWWSTAKDTVVSDADSQKYRWVKSPSECPIDKKGLWHIIKDTDSSMRGVESYDVATYSIIESARFSSANKAGKMVANTLNKIGTPCVTFGITGGDWKCDDISISWSGKYWLATLTWTRSGDSSGWNKKLYN